MAPVLGKQRAESRGKERPRREKSADEEITLQAPGNRQRTTGSVSAGAWSRMPGGSGSPLKEMVKKIQEEDDRAMATKILANAGNTPGSRGKSTVKEMKVSEDKASKGGGGDQVVKAEAPQSRPRSPVSMDFLIFFPYKLTYPFFGP